MTLSVVLIAAVVVTFVLTTFSIHRRRHRLDRAILDVLNGRTLTTEEVVARLLRRDVTVGPNALADSCRRLQKRDAVIYNHERGVWTSLKGNSR